MGRVGTAAGGRHRLDSEHAAAVAGERRETGRPNPPGREGERVGAAPEAKCLGDPPGSWIEAADRLIAAVGHPDRADARGDNGWFATHGKGGQDRVCGWVDARDGAVLAIGEPDTALPD